MPVHSADRIFQQAIAALNARQFADAERLFRRLLGSQPSHAGALNLLTIVLMNGGRFSEAETFIARAVALGGASDVSHYNYGLILKQLNRPADALQQFSQAAAIDPTVSETCAFGCTGVGVAVGVSSEPPHPAITTANAQAAAVATNIPHDRRLRITFKTLASEPPQCGSLW